jgi:hypothetical protein
MLLRSAELSISSVWGRAEVAEQDFVTKRSLQRTLAWSMK